MNAIILTYMCVYTFTAIHMYTCTMYMYTCTMYMYTCTMYMYTCTCVSLDIVVRLMTYI